MPAGKPIRIFDGTLGCNRDQPGPLRRFPCKVFQIVAVAPDHRAVAEQRFSPPHHSHTARVVTSWKQKPEKDA
jgi:hypothetical protein